MAELTFLTSVDGATGAITACAEQTPVYADDLIEAEVAAEGHAAGLSHHWPVQKGRRTVPVRDCMEIEWEQAVKDAVADWNAAQAWIAFAYQRGTPNEAVGVNGTVLLSTKAGEVPSGHNAIAHPVFNTQGVYRVLIYVRDSTYFNRQTGVDTFPYPQTPQRYAIVLHELGHAFVLPDTKPSPGRPAPYNAVIVGSQPMDTTCGSTGCSDGTGPVGQWCKERLRQTYEWREPKKNRRKRRKRRR